MPQSQSGGTIPDRGLFGVFPPDGGRAGELDEEMVYESRVGGVFRARRVRTWRTGGDHRRSGRGHACFRRTAPRPCSGRAIVRGGRSSSSGARRIGTRAARRMTSPGSGDARCSVRRPRRRTSRRTSRMYLDEQAEATGAVPDDRTIVIERFRDEIGDRRACILTPFGSGADRAPWALAIEDLLRGPARPPRAGAVERRRHHPRWPPIARRHRDSTSCSSTPTRSTSLVVRPTRPRTPRCSRRELAARTRPAPYHAPAPPAWRERTPLWQQRAMARGRTCSRSPRRATASFPILLETTRECLRDVFDLPALREVLTDVRSRRVRVVPVETRSASPFAQSLLFGWIAVYMYEGDAPLAERRVAALALDRDLLRDLLGTEELRELLDPAVIAELELELQRLAPERQARNADDLHDLLADLGPLDDAEDRRRCTCRPGQRVARSGSLRSERRVIRHVAARLAAAVEGAAGPAARRRSAGRSRPGLPAAFTEPVARPARRSRRPFRAHSRSVRARRRCRASRHQRRTGPRSDEPPRSRRPRRARRVPSGRRRA